ncbi:MAG: MFS transporter [Parvibaculum sp.]|uniref:MFS transporter n=1 Tax=Parvibaculum sp. TaxID=2024848 RepID=UPI0025DF4FF1|nr:MFS transporter [Parvibaculum sp.]MCE9650255.1 MFS transporter [Parvibaculum sp.]
MATLGLIEEFLLLTLEDEGGEFDNVPDIHLNCGLAGAALMDLALRGRIDSDLDAIWAVDTAPTGDGNLDKVLAHIAAEPARLDARTWIGRLSKDAAAIREAALRDLCAGGVLRQEDHRFLWVLKARRYPVVEGQERPEAKRRILALLFNDELPDPADVALIALADACFVFERILTPTALASVRARISQLGHMDLIGGEIARTAQKMNVELKAAERRTVIAGLAGNVMEWYDFGVYGFFALAIGSQFFPSHDPATSLLASFSVFAVGFLARPMGGLLFGHLGDRLGRRFAVIASVVMMVVPTCLMGLLPTYEQIGVAAPIILILLRLAQGLSVGGEYTTSMVLLVEEAQPKRRGRVGSFAPFGAFGGLLLGSAVGAALISILPPDHAAAWGWRAAFLFGLIIGLVVLYVRRRLPPEETILATEEARKSPIAEAFRTQWATILKVLGLNLANAVGFYLCFVFITTWLSGLGQPVPQTTALLLNSLGLLILMLATPVSGILSDRIGRKPMILLGTGGMAIFAWPLFWLMSHGTIPAIIAGQAGFALLMSCFTGASPAFMVEAFPKYVRCSGLSIGYNLALTIFGGTVPMVAVFLIARSGDALSPALYLSAAAAISFFMAVIIRGSQETAK